MSNTGNDTGQRETVTFLFTDIEGSTRLLRHLGESYHEVLERHREIIRGALAAAGGVEHGTEGDSFFASFSSAAAGVAAAVAAQRALRSETWPEAGVVCVRMGLHTGEAQRGPTGWVGIDVHRAARLGDAGHGGQVLLSAATLALVGDALPDGVDTRDLGAHRLKDIPAPVQIHQLVGEGLREEFPPLRSLDAQPNNLPTQLTSFIGRERQVAEAMDLLGRSRLLSLIGPGGTGKTRLALRLAAESLGHFGDGVWFVALAPVRDPALVAVSVLSALGVQAAGASTPEDALRGHVRDRRLLLVLDNFEQVLDAATLVADLLAASDHLRIVVTSRAALHVAGEQSYEVPPLTVPTGVGVEMSQATQYEAVNLFIERAMSVDPNFKLTPDNAAAVAEICARLDGLPLALELAAARIKLLPPQALLARLTVGLDVIAGKARDLPARQRTLRGAIAWSHDLLDEETQTLFARLSVFRGGWTFEEAEAVCSTDGIDVLSGLEALVDHSLVRQIERAGEPRFLMLETIREFAQEQCEASGEADEIRKRHGRTYLQLAERAEPELMGADGGLWLDRLEREMDNLRSAADWAASTDRDCGLRMGASLWRLWQMRGHLHEGRARLEDLVGSPDAEGDPKLLGRALEALGGVAYWQGDMDAAQRAYERMVEVERSRGDKQRVAEGTYNLSFMWLRPGEGKLESRDFDQGTALLQEALTMFESLGDEMAAARCRWALASATYERGGVLDDEGDHDAAQRCYALSLELVTECLRVFHKTDSWFDHAWALHLAGVVTMRLGQIEECRIHLNEGLDAFVAHGDISGIVLLLDDMSSLATLVGRPEDALRLRGATDLMQRQSGASLANLLNESERRVGLNDLNDEQRKFWDEGATLNTDAAITLARSL